MNQTSGASKASRVSRLHNCSNESQSINRVLRKIMQLTWTSPASLPLAERNLEVSSDGQERPDKTCMETTDTAASDLFRDALRAVKTTVIAPQWSIASRGTHVVQERIIFSAPRSTGDPSDGRPMVLEITAAIFSWMDRRREPGRALIGRWSSALTINIEPGRRAASFSPSKTR